MLFLLVSLILSPFVVLKNCLLTVVGCVIAGGITLFGLIFYYKEWRDSWGEWEKLHGNS
jgi:hypothetical protein